MRWCRTASGGYQPQPDYGCGSNDCGGGHGDACARGDDDRDHLCCGAAGDVDALVTHRSHTADLGARIDGTIDEIVDRWRRRIEGDEPFHFHDGVSFRAPSLFGGFAGVAWSLCRLAEPGAIPDVLAVG